MMNGCALEGDARDKTAASRLHTELDHVSRDTRRAPGDVRSALHPAVASGRRSTRRPGRTANTAQPRALPWATDRVRAILALLFANLIWGTTFVATKPLLEHIPPLTIATARFAVALLVLLPLLARSGARPARGRSVALMGLTGVFLVYLCQNMGLQYTTASNGALIHGGIPVFTVLLAAPIIGERLNLGRLIGVVVSMVGVVAIVVFGSGAELGLSAFGDSLLVASALALAAYLVLGRRAFPGGGSLSLVAGVARYGLLFLLPATAVELAVVGMARPTAADLLSLAYLGAIASALAFILWGYGLRHLEAGQAATFANINPLVGVAVAALLLGEPVTAAQIVGGLLILGGVWLATRQPRPTPAVRPDSAPHQSRPRPRIRRADLGGRSGAWARGIVGSLF